MLKRKIAVFMFSFLFLKGKLRAEMISSIYAGFGVEKFNRSVILPYGSYLYNLNGEYILVNNFIDNAKKVNWLSGIDEDFENPIGSEGLYNREKLVVNDIISSLNLSGQIYSLSVSPTLSYEFGNRLRLSIGGEICINFCNSLTLKLEPCNPDQIIDIVNANVKNLISKYKSSLSSTSVYKEISKNFDKIPKNRVDQIKKYVSMLNDNEDADLKRALVRVIKDYDKYCEKNNLDSESGSDYLSEYTPESKISFSFRPFLGFGIKLYNGEDVSFLVEYQFGLLLSYYKNMFDLNSIEDYSFSIKDIKKVRMSLGIHVVGLMLEQHISEFFTIVYKTAVQMYDNIQIDVENKNIFPIVYTDNVRVTADIGFLFRIPDDERCFIQNCAVQVKHRHNSYRMRGKNIFTGTDDIGRRLDR